MPFITIEKYLSRRVSRNADDIVIERFPNLRANQGRLLFNQQPYNILRNAILKMLETLDNSSEWGLKFRNCDVTTAWLTRPNERSNVRLNSFQVVPSAVESFSIIDGIFAAETAPEKFS